MISLPPGMYPPPHRSAFDVHSDVQKRIQSLHMLDGAFEVSIGVRPLRGEPGIVDTFLLIEDNGTQTKHIKSIGRYENDGVYPILGASNGL